MGRRILRSLRRSQPKPLDVKIEVDDGTVFEVNDGTVIVTSNEQDDGRDGLPDLVTEDSSVSTEKRSKRQKYVPPKIWSEEFESDSESDNQMKSCWYLGSAPQKREEERDYQDDDAGEATEERDEEDHFCAVFDCGCGVPEDEPEVRVMEAEEPDFLGENDDDDDAMSESMTHSAKDNVQSLVEMSVISVLSDSFEEMVKGDDNQEGVEQTEDSFWVAAAKTKDVDLDRKTRLKRIKKKLKKRRKGKRQRKERALSDSHKCEDNETIVSAETTSTTGDSTVISIKHVISDVESTEEERNRLELPVKKRLDDLNAAPVSPADDYDAPSVATSVSRETQTSEPEIAPTQRDTPLMDESTQGEPFISSKRSSPYIYESLSQNDSDEDAKDERRQHCTRYTSTIPDNSMLNRMFNAVEAGVGIFSFPEIPQPRKKRMEKPRSGRRVRFAPDTKFNDADEDYDYSLDYSYSDPEFEESFDEEAYYTTEDEASDDEDEAFFDDTPISRSTSTEKKETTLLALVSSSFDRIEKRESRDTNEEKDEQCVYDASDAILDFDDEEDVLEDVQAKMSLESEFEYYYPNEEPESDDEYVIKETSSSYKSIEEMQVARATSPFEPSMDVLEALQRTSTPPGSEDMYSTTDPELDCSEVDTVLVESQGDMEIAKETRLSYGSYEDDTSFVHPETPNDDDLSTGTEGLDLDAIAAAATATDIRGGIGCQKKPLKPPMPVKGLDVHVPEIPKSVLRKPERPKSILRSRSTRGLGDGAEQTRMNADTTDVDGVRSRRKKAVDLAKSTRRVRTQKRNGNVRSKRETAPPPEDECTDRKVGMTPNEALVERYLNISASCSDQVTEPDDLQSSPDQDDSSQESKQPAMPEETRLSNHKAERSETTESTVRDVGKEHTSSTKANERDDLSGSLGTPETEADEAQIFIEGNEFTKDSLSPSTSLEAAPEWNVHTLDETNVAPNGFHSQNSSVGELGSCSFRRPTVGEQTIDRVVLPRKGYTKGKISDKKASLQLSLQGFARAKDTSQWASFNNRPFQDLEEAPFDEM